MPDQRGLGNHGTESRRPRQSQHGDNHMNEQDDEVAHPGNGNNTSQADRIQAKLAIRHRQAQQQGWINTHYHQNKQNKYDEARHPSSRAPAATR